MRLNSFLLHPNSSARSSVHLVRDLPRVLDFVGFQRVVSVAQSGSVCFASFIAYFHFLFRAQVVQSDKLVLLLIAFELFLSDIRIPSIALSSLLWLLLSFIPAVFVSAQISQP